MTARRKMVLAGVAVCAAAMTAVSVAWACTPSGSLSVSPGSGLAGSTVRVSGSGFVADSEAAPVQIRWNTTAGRVLATASAPSFSTAVTIPEGATARTYSVVAVQRQADGSIARQASAPFTVTAPAGQTAPATESPAPQPQTRPEPQPQPQPGTGSKPEVAPAPAPAPAEPAPARAEASPAPAAAPASAAAAARRRAAAAPADTARTRSVERSIAGGDAGPPSSSPAVEPVASSSEPAAALPEPAVQTPAASPRSASADVWSGFGDGSLSRSSGPSLIGSPAASQSGNSVRIGVGLLALGTVGLLGGALVAVRSRRPSVAERTS